MIQTRLWIIKPYPSVTNSLTITPHRPPNLAVVHKRANSRPKQNPQSELGFHPSPRLPQFHFQFQFQLHFHSQSLRFILRRFRPQTLAPHVQFSTKFCLNSIKVVRFGNGGAFEGSGALSPSRGEQPRRFRRQAFLSQAG